MAQTAPATRRNIWIPDDLWRQIVRAAAAEQQEKGEPVSAAEWIRTAIEQRLSQ